MRYSAVSHFSTIYVTIYKQQESCMLSYGQFSGV